MIRTDVVIIGAGQAGLAASRCLSDLGIENVVLERGRIAERWRSERWDSLRLLTPNWQSRLPGWRYSGLNPSGYMTKSEVVDYLRSYAGSFSPVIEENTGVRRVEGTAAGYRVQTTGAISLARNVIVATGYCDVPHVPAMAQNIDPSVEQIVPSNYRRPSDVPEGGVLVVGASATGIQLADELNRAGRKVHLAVGQHTRLPREYRRKDIMWWLDATGALGEGPADVVNLPRAKTQPSLQLVGRPSKESLDLGVLAESGVEMFGRLVEADGSVLRFAEDLDESIARAERKLSRVVRRIDDFAARFGLDRAFPKSETAIRPVEIESRRHRIDVRATGIRTILWCTGFRRHYPWLKVPVLDGRGEIEHRGGVTAAPGLYVLGMQMLRTRRSSYIDGVGDDARAITADIARSLNVASALAA